MSYLEAAGAVLTNAIALAWSAIEGFPTWASVVLWPVGRLVLMVLAGFVGGWLFLGIVKQAAFNQARKRATYQRKADPWSL